MHYNRHISYDMSGNIIHITLPQYLDKHDKCGRTCRNCLNVYWENEKMLCFLYDNEPTRNPRSRAIKCKGFEHFLDSLYWKILSSKETTHP